MYEVRYHRPATLAEAVALFSEGSDARYLAGGQTLIPTMKQRLAAPSDVIDVLRLPELQGISLSADLVTIGGATTHAAVAAAEAVRRTIPALADLAGLIGDPAVRHRGTIGGSLANNDPAADWPAPVLALGATIRTDRREIAAEDFFQGLFTTALEPGELITAVSFPVPETAAYAKFKNPASRYAMAGVFAARMKDGAVRVAVTGAHGDGVFRSAEIERALLASWTPEAVEAVTVSPEGMLSDVHGSAAYRANLVKVMAKRAVAATAG
jgi:carbon-monoxide dehydrogenase medium subunit